MHACTPNRAHQGTRSAHTQAHKRGARARTVRDDGVAEREQPEEGGRELWVGLARPGGAHEAAVVKVEVGLAVLVVALLVSHVQLQPAPARLRHQGHKRGCVSVGCM